MIDNNYRIRDINNKSLCICYYIKNSSDINSLTASLESQFKNTNLKDYSLILFTSADVYNIIKNSYKNIIGLTNIIKVNPLFLTSNLLMSHPIIHQYKYCIIYKPTTIIKGNFDYKCIVEYHSSKQGFLCNGFNNKFSDTFNNLIKDSFKNTLQLTVNELKSTILSCYCSRVNKVSKFNELFNSNVPSTNCVSFSTILTKSPTFQNYIIGIIYSGIKCSDIVLQVYTNAKGYKFEYLSITGLKLNQ